MAAISDELKGGLAAYRGSVAITTSDSVDIKGTRGIICDSGGAVKVTFIDDTTDTITLIDNLAYPFQVTRIWATGTVATGIHALY